jgi:rfaE bifunctional protein kinase chain/domain/rfaE bifunctional protein nucleotidyltransferase chain/domain
MLHSRLLTFTSELAVMNKIIEINELAAVIQTHKSNGKKTVLCHGVFDLMHIGHIRYFEEASKMADVLIVTLTQDVFVNKGPGRPAFTEALRAEAIAALECVDHVSINQWPTAIETLHLLKPDFYVKGPDYKDPSNDPTGNIKREIEAIESVGGVIRYTEDITFSSSRLLVAHSSMYSKEQREFMTAIGKEWTFDEIKERIQEMSSQKVLLIGEIIIDQYVFCNAIGKSGKEPVMVVKRLDSEIYLGGILAIANHLSQFVKEVEIVSYIGEKSEYLELLQDSMPSNVKLKLVRKKGATTIIKTRYLDKYSKARILGVYDIEDSLISQKEEAEVIGYLDTISDFDLVLVADYGHGLITPEVVRVLESTSKFLAVNTQVNASNIGFHTISKYTEADFVCIHEGELRHDYRSRTDKAEHLAKMLYNKMKCEHILITMGKKGSFGYNTQNGTVYCPAFASQVVDRVGAGDSVLAMTSLALACQFPLDLTLLLGNLAGAQAVATIGNKKATQKELLLKSIKAIL